ncbi:hypothetical protein EVAR_52856_1 [Eumeta japonica]|uniref:Uncharacterized protein n=1 Tax=Eumeta variegata TaxID=151549 RepID=A0A4C1YE61_EUMVA|nr:hypothetical protein EVAR_52856_1 [Eumeta japonica]
MKHGYCYMPERKQRSSVWAFENDSKPTKLRQGRSGDKKMIAFFFSKTGPVCTISLEEQKAVNTECHAAGAQRTRSSAPKGPRAPRPAPANNGAVLCDILNFSIRDLASKLLPVAAPPERNLNKPSLGAAVLGGGRS